MGTREEHAARVVRNALRDYETLDAAYCRKKVRIDLRGHWAQFNPRGFLGYAVAYPRHRAALARLACAIRERRRLQRPVAFPGFHSDACTQCGAAVRWESDGRVVRPRRACRYADGFPPYSFELNVPSGVLAVADNLRPVYEPNGSYDINTAVGVRAQALASAAIGCAHGFVGNSCPSIVRVGERHYVVTDQEYAPPKDPRGRPAEELGGITTNLWWYSIADAADYDRRRREQQIRDYAEHRIRVEPGVYRFTNYSRGSRDSEDKPFVYAEFRWVRPLDRPRRHAC